MIIPQYRASLCWEQNKNHSYSNFTKYVEQTSPEQCIHTVTSQAKDWFATKWFNHPGIKPNGTHWSCGANLWPWLPHGCIGRCFLGFAWLQSRSVKSTDKPVNLPCLQLSRSRGLFYQYDHLASVFIPSLELEDVIQHIKALTNYTQQTFKLHCNESLSSMKK